MNQLRDFRLFRWQHGPQKGLESIWLFRFAKCDNFANVLSALRALPEDTRHYYVEEELWAFRPTTENEKLLAWLFDNFRVEIALARQQPELPILDELPITRQLPWLKNQGVTIIQGRS
jgi:hypothetical protein